MNGTINWWWIISPSAIVLIAAIGGLYAFGVWKGKTDSDVNALMDFMKEIRDDIKKIFERLPPSPVGAGSPMRLTELGEEISRELSAKEWANRTAQDLASGVKGMKDFEIHDYCVQFVNEKFEPDEEQETRIRESAYEHGIEREKVLSVLAIELRDVLLNRADDD